MARLFQIIKLLLTGLVGAAVGTFVFAILFSDFGPSETVAGRGIILLLLLLISGLVIGFITPEAWGLSGLTAWGSVLLGAVGLLRGGANRFQQTGLLLLPLGFALAAGYLGALARRKRLLQRLFR